MRHPLIRQGEGPAAAHERIQREQGELRRALDRNARHPAAALDSRRVTSTPGGDPRELRGIPAIGRNVAGAIPGTSPHGVCQKRPLTSAASSD